jgi:hypothetical protein
VVGALSQNRAREPGKTEATKYLAAGKHGRSMRHNASMPGKDESPVE